VRGRTRVRPQLLVVWVAFRDVLGLASIVLGVAGDVPAGRLRCGTGKDRSERDVIEPGSAAREPRDGTGHIVIGDEVGPDTAGRCSGADMRNLPGAVSVCGFHPTASMPWPSMPWSTRNRQNARTGSVYEWTVRELLAAASSASCDEAISILSAGRT
jgi:hypothetical protein